MHEAISRGVAVFDTAGFYANGEAERRLGEALTSADRDKLMIVTKVGTRGEGRRLRKDFSHAAIREDVEASLRRLKLDYLDAVLLHGPMMQNIDQSLELFDTLKAEGKIRFAGVCGDGPRLSRAGRTRGVDIVMGVYNFIHQEHADGFAEAKSNGKMTLAVAPLAQGLYRKGFFTPKSPSDAWYIARAFLNNRSEMQSARELAPLLEAPDWTPAQLALAFVLENEHIDCAITTTTRSAHLAQSAAAVERSAPAEVMAKLTSLASSA